MKLLVKPLFLFALAATTAIGARANGEAARSFSKLSTDLESNLLDEITETGEWTVYKEIPSVRIEYRFQECNSKEVMGYHNTNVVFFRFTNLTRKKIELTWISELYFNGECANCKNQDHPEYHRSLTLKPREVIEGNPDFRDDNLSIPSNFIKKVEGMSDSKLTDFKFVNLEAKVIR